MISARLFAAVLVVAPLAGFVFACGGGDKSTGVADAKLPTGVRPEALAHEGCDESGNRVEVLDTNNDGKPDIRRVFNKSSGREVCRVVDLNHDGQPDLYEFFDANGTIRRREFCYDDTGVVNAIEYYEGGKLVRREYDTSGQHKIDTWDYFDPAAPVDAKTGRPTHPSRRERDTTGSGHVDQWWTWDGDKVTIAVDANGDGKPDPASALTLGGDDNGGGSGGSASAGADGGASSATSAASDAGGATPSSVAPDAGASTRGTSGGDGGK